jgi:hypothetical protein
MNTTAKFVCILCVTLFTFSSCTEDLVSHFPSEVKVNSLMNEAMKKSDLPAVVAIAVNKKGEKIVYTHGPEVWSETNE